MRSPVEWWKQAVGFFGEVRSEIQKCSFPSRDEVVGTTVVVIVTSIVFALFLWIADMAIIKGYQGIIRVFGS
jgi:preprotein translocase subunit SecE